MLQTHNLFFINLKTCFEKKANTTTNTHIRINKVLKKKTLSQLSNTLKNGLSACYPYLH